jgi:hypothetical protein
VCLPALFSEGCDFGLEPSPFDFQGLKARELGLKPSYRLLQVKNSVRKGMFAIQASAPSGSTLIVDILISGDVFGEFAVFSRQRRRTTAVTALPQA